VVLSRRIRPVVALLAALLVGCSFASSPALPGDSLARRIEADEAPVVLDVRTDSEYASGHVPGAVHIPFQKVASRLHELPAEKDETVVVYCAHGPRAAWAGRALRNAGYTDVVYLEGHMSAWEAAELPLEKSATAGEP
jgi:rhodanese-related sulfurtransferase